MMLLTFSHFGAAVNGQLTWLITESGAACHCLSAIYEKRTLSDGRIEAVVTRRYRSAAQRYPGDLLRQSPPAAGADTGFAAFHVNSPPNGCARNRRRFVISGLGRSGGAQQIAELAGAGAGCRSGKAIAMSRNPKPLRHGVRSAAQTPRSGGAPDN